MEQSQPINPPVPANLQKKFPFRKLFIGIILLMMVLFAPIPGIILGDVLCYPCKMGQVCPRCPQKGDLVWNPSLAQQLYHLLFNKPKLITREDLPIPTPTVNPTADWKTYTNSSYGFLFKYPASAMSPNSAFVKEQDNKQAGQFIVDATTPGLDFILEVQLLGPNDSKGYLGSVSEETIKTTSLSWDLLKNQGYCDAGTCSEPFLVYLHIKNNYRYAFIFNNTTTKTQLQTSILSTFQFIDQKQSNSIYSSRNFGIRFQYDSNKVLIREIDPNSVSVFRINAMSYFFRVTKYVTRDTLTIWWDKNSANFIKSVGSTIIFKGKPSIFLKHNDIMQVPSDSYLVQMNGYILKIDFGVEPDLQADYQGDTTGYTDHKLQFDKEDKPLNDTIMNSFEFL